MSVFTNPADGAEAQAEAYVAAILDLLGERDPLAVLSETAGRLRDASAGLTDAQLAAPESDGKWSIVHVLQHMADSELVWGYRLRRVLAEDRPVIHGYDQDAWADRLGYRVADREVALATFEALRGGNVALLRSLSADDRGRVGVHEERGEESVESMIPLYAGHDLLHVAQVERIRHIVVR